MPLLGIQFTLLMGKTVPRPAPVIMTEAFVNAEITQSDEGRSGFQLTFALGRTGATTLRDYSLVDSNLLEPLSRVIVAVTLNATPQVLIDGMITHQQLLPSEIPGASRLVITGEDVSVMMDLEEKIVEHPAQPEAAIATKIIARYAKYGLIPKVIPPVPDSPPLPTERIPVQHGTDLEHLQTMAQRHGYVFYIIPGPVPGTNTAYWGPPNRIGTPQPALSVNMGESSNVESINFRYDALAPTLVAGQIQDRKTNQSSAVRVTSSKRPPLARQAAVRTQSQVRQVIPQRIEGLTQSQAAAIAQATIDTSTDRVVTVEGELDVTRYANILHARSLVGVRGVGDTYDGLYYVKQVTHQIEQGEYRQSFTLTREGLGAIAPIVKP